MNTQLNTWAAKTAEAYDTRLMTKLPIRIIMLLLFIPNLTSQRLMILRVCSLWG